MGEEPAAFAEPGNTTVRAPHEVGAMGLTVLVGREDVIVVVEGERQLRVVVAPRVQSASRSPDLEPAFLKLVGGSEGRDGPGLIPALIRRELGGRQRPGHGVWIAQPGELA